MLIANNLAIRSVIASGILLASAANVSPSLASGRNSLLGVSPSASVRLAVQTEASMAGRFMPEGRAMPAPSAFLELCVRSPQDCEVAEGVSSNEIRSRALAALKQRQQMAEAGNLQRDVASASVNRHDRATPQAPQAAKIASEFKMPWRLRKAPVPFFSANDFLAHEVQKAQLVPAEATKLAFLLVAPPSLEASGVEASDAATDNNANAEGKTIFATSSDSWAVAKRKEMGRAVDGLVKWDREMLKTVRNLNADVNASLVPDTDEAIYHVSDYWRAPGMERGSRADCEDYALQKRRQLLDLGIPDVAMSIAIVKTRYGEIHAVLLLETDAGEYVLDNLAYNIKLWNKTNYVWISRQSRADKMAWVSLENTGS